MIYTLSERTVKKYTVYQAVTAACCRLGKDVSICMDATRNRAMSEPITLEELNRLSDQLMGDTLYWRGDFNMRTP